MNESIIFTKQAARKVWELIQEEGNLALKLRVYVTGGGCSGFKYGFTFDETQAVDDTVITQEIDAHQDENNNNSHQQAVQLLIDGMSIQYLKGAEIDYVENIEGEQFVIRNPNAQTTCGCGSSFSA